MKKILFNLICTSILLCFSGCELLAGLLKQLPEGGGDYAEVTDSLVIPIYEKKTDLSDYLYDNDNQLRKSKIYLIQVNTSIEESSYTRNGTLNKVVYNTNIPERNASENMTSENLFPYEVPYFVRNFKKPVLSEDDLSLFRENSIPVNISFSDLEIGDSRSFYLPENERGSFRNKECKFVYSSEFADIYYLDDTSDYIFTDEDFKKLGSIFDKIYSAEILLMGDREIVPKTGYKNIYVKTPPRVSIVLNDIYNDFTNKSNSGTFGYFSPIDLYSEYGKNYFGYSFGNSDQIIYIDSPFYKKYPDTAISTLAHEFNHLINFVNKEINADCDSEATWFSEMLSLLSEDILYDAVLKKEGVTKNSVLENRLPWFNGSYNYGTNFNSGNADRTYAAYGNVFAYGSFLVRNYGGAELLHEIATNEYTDEDSISAALYELGKYSYFDDEFEATYEDTLLDFAGSSLNYSISYGSKARSLNRSISNRMNGITYKADSINLLNYYQASPNGNKKINGMKIFDNGVKESIGPHGFMVQYAGTSEEISEISVTLPSSSNYNIQMYCYIQYFD